MAINVNAEIDDGVWCEYDSDVKIKIRAMTPKIVKSSKRKFLNIRRLRGEVIESMSSEQEEKWDDWMNDYIIEDWDGIIQLDKNGKQEKFECNTNNKKFFLNKYSALKAWIIERAGALAEETSNVELVIEKNL